ncbi:hypothetical protein EHQ61_14480 [Leptospira wolffii]|uniref:hypothetical protein n=1 Tax=Leptospira wolffii TaxID=409998 RepID=UPI001084501F|nr:hypothetical protein [Leptospira wolffii]TGL49630.1 hypothetical protein EHQ61_14480 [Leptospira wolffii]
MQLSAKNHLRLHRYVGILSAILLFSRPFLFHFWEWKPLSPEILSLYVGRVGAVLGALAFFTGGGLGKYLSEEKSRTAEIHTILMLGGLILQIPILAEAGTSIFLNILSYFGYLFLFSGWILGRRVFRNRKRILPF